MKDQEVLRGGKWLYFLNNKEVTEEEYRAVYPLPEMGGCFAGPALKGWPIISDSQMVHPKQIAEARDLDIRKGVPTDYTPKGQPVFRDRMHRRAWLKAHNKVDRNSYTGY